VHCSIGEGKTSGSFLKKRTKKLLQVQAEPIRKDRSRNDQKFFASFFQKRRPSFRLSLLPLTTRAARAGRSANAAFADS
jgi:hypothetical protein